MGSLSTLFKAVEVTVKEAPQLVIEPVVDKSQSWRRGEETWRPFTQGNKQGCHSS